MRSNQEYIDARIGQPPKEEVPDGFGMGMGDERVPYRNHDGSTTEDNPATAGAPAFTILEGLTGDQRKCFPIKTGALDYFPNAIALVALNSLIGNVQHSGPGKPLQWIRGKSPDHEDCATRHSMEGGNAKVSAAWRQLAELEESYQRGEIDVRAMLEELEAAKEQARNGGA